MPSAYQSGSKSNMKATQNRYNCLSARGPFSEVPGAGERWGGERKPPIQGTSELARIHDIKSMSIPCSELLFRFVYISTKCEKYILILTNIDITSREERGILVFK